MTADLGRAALALARRGLRVHPCRPDSKLPLLDDWPNRASLDPRTIKSWWRRWPTANVAIATGGEMRLLVVDVDPDAGGEATLAVLEREHGALPATTSAAAAEKVACPEVYDGKFGTTMFGLISGSIWFGRANQ
jgi:Bifunctional DNA primase/polymerase, N-terminal